MKKLLAATALAGFLAAAPAIAQDAMTPADAPAATTDKMDAASVPTERFITLQAPDDWIATSLIGSTVYGPADENLGEINDLVVAGDGQVKAVVIGVGGFLGIGEKDVAVGPTTLERIKDGDSVKYRLTTTKDELTAAPEFKTVEEAVDESTTSSTPAEPVPAVPAEPPAAVEPLEPATPMAPAAPSPATP